MFYAGMLVPYDLLLSGFDESTQDVLRQEVISTASSASA